MSQPPNVPRPLAGGSSEFADRIRALRSDARVGAALLACVAIAAGVAWFRAGIAPSEPAAAGPSGSSVVGDSPTTTAAVTTSTTTTEIVVDVVGAVRAPGVVTLPGDARVVDAIRAAGGTAAGADLVPLNLAAKLTDGARVAVPRFGEPPPTVDPNAVTGGADPPGSATGTSDGSPVGGLIDVNTASADELEALPGIGPTLAAAIVDERERNGPFDSVDDLNRVPGIGDGRLGQIRDLVTV